MSVPGLYLVAASPSPGKTTLGVALSAALSRAGLRVCAAKPIELGCSPLPAQKPSPSGELLDAPVLASLSRLRALAGPPPPSTFASLPPDLLEPRDTPLLLAASSVEAPLERLACYRFALELDPAVAARLSGRPIDLRTVVDSVAELRARAEFVIIEGGAGLCSPLGERELELDLVAKLALPALVVAPSRPGCVHAVLASMELLRGRAVPCAGIVLCRRDRRPLPEEACYPYEIERFAGPLVRGVLPYLDDSDRLHLGRLARRAAVHLDLDAITGRRLPVPGPA